jgi:N-acetylmuramoyl-L-alanine amidase
MKKLVAIAIVTIAVISCSVPIMGTIFNKETVVITVQEDNFLTTNNEEIIEISTEEADTEDEIEQAINEMNEKMEKVDSIGNTKEWYIAYKEVIDEYADIIDPPETIYDYFTEDELDLLFKVVQAEVGDEYSFEQKCNVASTILNRLDHEAFPDTIKEVLTANQFQTIANGRYKKVEVSEDTILACEYTFEIEDTTNGALFFDSNNTLKYKFLFNDEAHNFYTLRN